MTMGLLRLVLAFVLAALFLDAACGGQLPCKGVGARGDHEGRRLLVGSDSTPPTCWLRCGSCLPCVPVQVTIQPVGSLPPQYYPVVWRCKCGDKLFMPQ